MLYFNTWCCFFKNCYFFKIIEIIGAVLGLCTVTSLK